MIIEGRSTITLVISYFESIILSQEEGKHVDAVYVDFAYAPSPPPR